jgi:hypothetical protein
MKRLLLLVIASGACCACASTHDFERICGPLSSVSVATVVDLRVIDKQQCSIGSHKPAALTNRLKAELLKRFPTIQFGGKDDALTMFFAVSDIPRGCIFPSWHWTVELAAWLPTPLSPTGGTLAAIVEIHGTTRVRGDFVGEALDQVAAIRQGVAVLPRSTVRCGYGLNATP